MTSDTRIIEEPRNPDPNRIIAAIATLIVALLLLMLLLLVHLQLPTRSAAPDKANLEMAPLEADMPEFIEPELLTDAGDLQSEQQDDPAPTPDGQPDLSEQKSDRRVVNGQNPEPNPSAEKLVKSSQPSPKKATDPSPKNQPDTRIADQMNGQFSPHNGTPSGSSRPSANSGAGGTGSGAKGTMKGGRKLLSCPLPTVTLRQKVVIKVEVYVDAAGKVTEATVISGSSDPSLREKCRQASLKARWTPKADAPRTRGVITWTLEPRI